MKFSNYLKAACFFSVIFLCVVSSGHAQQNLRAWQIHERSPVEASSLSTFDTGILHKDGDLLWGGKLRKYYYYEPGAADSTPMPPVILLHGGGGTIDRFIGQNISFITELSQSVQPGNNN